MQLDPEASERTVQHLADGLGLDLRECARGILEVADAKMKRALEVISLEKGYDPRDFTLVSFGGAGGLHACRLAEALDMPRVLVPRSPGVLSAYGMLHADFQRLVSRTLLEPLEACLDEPARLQTTLAALARDAIGDLDTPLADFDLEVVAQLRYEGQSYEIDVPVDWHPEGSTFEDPTERFEARHETLYGYRAEKRAVELVGVRLTASQPGPEPLDYTQQTAGGDAVEPRDPREATVGFAETDAEATILDRRTLDDGDTPTGPAVIAEYSGTTVVPPGWSGEVRRGHLVLER
jgi:N-methylhydantoinase A